MVKNKIDDFISQGKGPNKKKVSRFLHIAIVTSFLPILIILLTLPWEKKKSKLPFLKGEKHLTEVAPFLQKIWREGDVGALKRQGIYCTEEFGDLFHRIQSELYFRCNPSFLNCFIRHYNRSDQQRPFTFESFRTPNNPEKSFHYQLISRVNYQLRGLPPFTVRVRAYWRTEGKTRNGVDIFLEDSCNDAYLPQRVYAISPFRKNQLDREWKWDNFHHHFFVDKNYVTFRDIRDWILHDIHIPKEWLSNLEKNLPEEQIDYARPAIGLTLEQMRYYCLFRGKELLESRILDAASFHPVDFNQVRRDLIFRGPFPWGYEGKKEGLDLCSKIRGKGCGSGEISTFPLESSPTWIGMFNSLGGFPEIVENKVDPEKNLHPSSIYLNIEDSRHQIGVRESWKGINDEIKPAFRCMKLLRAEVVEFEK